MRLIFFGTGSFAIPALEALKSSVVLVVTQPDRPQGRGMKLHPTEVKTRALELGLRVETPEKTRAPEFVDTLRREHSDALVVASYGQILSQAVLDSAIRGGINLHGSILPYYRGAAPIQRSILEGQSETGVSLMQMDKGMDTGAVIEIAKTPIDPDETYTTLQDRLAIIAARLATDWMSRIVEGDYISVPQNSSFATMAPKVDRGETELQWEGLAQDEYNRFRAFTNTPGTFLTTKIGRLRIHQARLSEGSGAPGEILAAKDSLTVAFGSGAIQFLELQPEGKKRMAARDFANGARLKAGDILSI